MKIAIFCTGTVGQTFPSKLIILGHDVMMGTLNISEKLISTARDVFGNPPFNEWHIKNMGVKLGTFAEAAAFGEIIFERNPGCQHYQRIKAGRCKRLKREKSG
ncbi:MAG: hypothetical protein R6W31_08850 [Bacteroidales bacterium]